MNALILSFNDFSNKTGLFWSSHYRIKEYNNKLNHLFVLNIRFYDSPFLYFLKMILLKRGLKKGDDSFYFDGIKYKNVWLKRGLFSSLSSWGKFDKIRVFDFMCHHKFTNDFDLINSVSNQTFKFNFILAHWGFPNGLIAKRLSEIFNLPYFITFHGSDINIWPYKNRIFFKNILISLKYSKKNIFVSKALLVKARTIYPELNGFVSYNGVSDFFINSKIEKKSLKDYVTILFVGNFNFAKRADKFYEIVSNILSYPGINFNFIFVGEGEYLNINKSKLAGFNNVYFLGYCDNKQIVDLYKISDILILPSRNEGLPLVVLEALVFNLIPIVSNVGGVSEILQKEYLVDDSTNFESDFAKKVIYFSKNLIPPSFDENKFSWKNIIKLEMDLLFSNEKN